MRTGTARFPVRKRFVRPSTGSTGISGQSGVKPGLPRRRDKMLLQNQERICLSVVIRRVFSREKRAQLHILRTLQASTVLKRIVPFSQLDKIAILSSRDLTYVVY